LTDTRGRPCVLLLTPGNVNDIAMAPALLAEVGRPVRRLLGDKGYDANSLRALLAEQGTSAVIPSTASRKVAIPYDVRAYRKRNLVERMFCRLKDFRRVATRYDKLARNFLAGTMIAAALIWWLN
jgi:transposase